jgi:hypothetical protein
MRALDQLPESIGDWVLATGSLVEFLIEEKAIMPLRDHFGEN